MKMNDPLISIIVPVYNVEKHIERCVCSLLNQTYSNIEVVLVDDGSVDNSGSICEILAETDNRILAIHKENGGPSSARNAGIDACHGDYIMFCDGDDFVHQQWAETLIRESILHTDSLTICGYTNVDENGVVLTDVTKPEGEYPKEAYFKLFTLTGTVCVKIFNKKLLNDHKIRFDESVFHGEDVFFTIDYLDLAEITKFYVINYPLYYYVRYRIQQRKSLSKEVSYFQMKAVYEKRIGYISEEDIDQYQRFVFSNLWDRFNDLMITREYKNSNRKEEMKAILEDEFFQEYLSKYGERLFDYKSLKLLQERKVALYCFLQKVASIKRRVLKQGSI